MNDGKFNFWVAFGYGIILVIVALISLFFISPNVSSDTKILEEKGIELIKYNRAWFNDKGMNGPYQCKLKNGIIQDIYISKNSDNDEYILYEKTNENKYIPINTST